ncbi:hypothetical protein CSUB01_12111 [Colletotrichum sublineola]|uniref:Uncharacterized protein n=1 Tax=Colletotrichum sublineola TaxID=1173701 RepID=A0A066WTP8_COLSU|nr:hypothetical protein CSUB01_12111 [Colletotrichum sublineola]
MKVPEILIEPEKGLGYIRFVITDDDLTFDKASKLLTKFQTLKPIVTKDSSVHISEKKTTIDARTCSQVTMDVVDQINVIIIKDLPACNYVVTNRPIGGPPLPPLA